MILSVILLFMRVIPFSTKCDQVCELQLELVVEFKSDLHDSVKLVSLTVLQLM